MAQSTAASRYADPAEVAPPPLALDLVQGLKVSGHLMSLPAGLFCIINEPGNAVNNGPPGTGITSGLPGIRISQPPNGNPDIEIAGFRADGWLAANGDAALVKINRGPAQVLVTIYQSPNAADAAPKLQVRQLIGGVAAPDQTPAPVKKMDVMAHVQARGDVGAKFGDWLGQPGDNNWIEGFAIAAPEGIAPADLSYQAVLGRGWLSPWVEAGQYCGSRGMALPLLGLRVRLQRTAAEQFELSCSATFIDGSAAGPVGSDETCESVKLAPLEAMRVTLIPRAPKPGRVKR